MALDHMAIISGGLWPTSPADTTERHEYIISRGLFTDFPGYVLIETVFNTILRIGSGIMSFTNSFFRIG